MPLDPEISRRQQQRRRSEQKWKIVFRFLAILFAIIGLIIQSLVAVQSTRPRRRKHYYYYDSIWFSPESFTFFAVSLIWCSAELITMRANKRGIHPGALVAIDLILWMGLLSAGLVEILVNYWNGLSAAAGGLGVTCSVLHFILFVWACVDTDRRRKQRRQEMIEQLAAAMYREQQEERNLNSKGSYNVPPGMALVPIETLAQLNQPLPTYNQQATEL